MAPQRYTSPAWLSHKPPRTRGNDWDSHPTGTHGWYYLHLWRGATTQGTHTADNMAQNTRIFDACELARAGTSFNQGA